MELDPEEIKEDPFVSAIQTDEQFLGQPLQAWSPARKIAAQCMGMIYPFLGDGGKEQFERTGTYPGMIRDVVVFLHVRRLERPEQITSAQREPSAAWTAAEAWAESVGLLDLMSPAFREGSALFIAKMAALVSLYGEPEKTKDSTSPKASCPPPGGQTI
jgi:hypothetical protein